MERRASRPPGGSGVRTNLSVQQLYQGIALAMP